MEQAKGMAGLHLAGLLTIGMSALASLLPPSSPSLWPGLAGFLLFTLLYETSLRLRRRALWILLAESVTGIFLLALFPHPSGPVYLLFVTASGFLIHLPLRRALAAVLSLWAGTALVLRLVGADWPQVFVAEVEIGTGFFFVATFTLALLETDRERQKGGELVARLREAHASLRAQGELERELAVAEERTRLAREIHDTLGHHLTALGLQLETALREEAPGARERIRSARHLAHAALQEVRRSVQALRPGGLEGKGLLDALRQMAEEFRQETGLPLHLRLPHPLPPLDLERQVTLYRTLEESLTNIRRHARAEGVWIRLLADRDQLILLVFDRDPRVAAPPADRKEGYGLLGLRERAQHLSGRLTAGILPGRGFLLRLRLPVVPPDESREPTGEELP